MRILIVEDEFNLADAIKSRLKEEKYSVDISCDGEEGLYNILNGQYDLVILDVMLPHKSGFEILKEIRKRDMAVKVIILTAKDLLEDKLNGFEYGANDYLTKPFYMEELIARVNVWLRNNQSNASKDYLEVGDLKLNIRTSNLICTTTNESIDIICKEFLILEYFMYNPNQIISKSQVYDKIWGIDNEVESNNLEAYLSFIRKKLKIIGSHVTIKAVRGLGYRLEVNNEKDKK